MQSWLEICTNRFPPEVNSQLAKIGNQGKVIENLLVLVSESRSSVRLLICPLSVQLRQMVGKVVYDRLSLLLQPYDIKI